jgi:hypothetical protein
VSLAGAGYAGTPLQTKLGVKPGARVALIGAPDSLAEHLTQATFSRRLAGRFDVILLFATTLATLERSIPRLLAAREPDGAIWIAWPKQSSRLQSDLTDAVVRNRLVQTGLVDNKVCAIDATWSGLRFVARRTPRASS